MYVFVIIISCLVHICLVVSHNKSCLQKGEEPIRSVMCPGLGTAVGRMPFVRCAEQVTLIIINNYRLV